MGTKDKLSVEDTVLSHPSPVSCVFAIKNAHLIGKRMVFLAANLCSSAHSFIFILFKSLFFDKSTIFVAFNELVQL